MRVFVCGTGQPLYYVAKSLISKGYELTFVCPNPEDCMLLAENFKTQVINGDPTKESILGEAGLEQNQVMVTIFNDDSVNYVIAQIALKRFQVKRAIAMVNNPANEVFFKKSGVQVSINIPNIIGSLVEEGVNEEVINLQSIEDGKLILMLVLITDKSPVKGRSLKMLSVISGAKIGALIRNGELMDNNQEIQAGDKLMVLTTPTVQGRIIREYTGEK